MVQIKVLDSEQAGNASYVQDAMESCDILHVSDKATLSNESMAAIRLLVQQGSMSVIVTQEYEVGFLICLGPFP